MLVRLLQLVVKPLLGRLGLQGAVSISTILRVLMARRAVPLLGARRAEVPLAWELLCGWLCARPTGRWGVHGIAACVGKKGC